MKKGLYLLSIGQLLLLFCVMRSASTAFAASIQANAPRAHLASATLAQPGWHRPWGRRENNQYIGVIANNTNNKYYVGYNQGNSGNSGVNHRYNEDHSTNAGNQIIHRGTLRHSRNNQLFQEIVANAENYFYAGQWQGNSGNSGVNSGFNRDTSANLGNQDQG